MIVSIQGPLSSSTTLPTDIEKKPTRKSVQLYWRRGRLPFWGKRGMTGGKNNSQVLCPAHIPVKSLDWGVWYRWYFFVNLSFSLVFLLFFNVLDFRHWVNVLCMLYKLLVVYMCGWCFPQNVWYVNKWQLHRWQYSLIICSDAHHYQVFIISYITDNGDIRMKNESLVSSQICLTMNL